MNLVKRCGSKRLVASKLIPLFPEHDIFIEMFFGAGGLFFNKPKVKYNFVNDLDSDIYNLYNVAVENPRGLIKAFDAMPIHQDLWNYQKKHPQTDPITKAARFLFLANYGFMGGQASLLFDCSNQKQNTLKRISRIRKALGDVKFLNEDFRNVFRKISLKGTPTKRVFVYADPPYLGTASPYEQGGFKFQDFVDLLDVLQGSGYRFAVSEFDNPLIIKEAKKRGLNIHEIGERQNLKNRRTEILITNYQL